jgi:hypothetical protein
VFGVVVGFEIRSGGAHEHSLHIDKKRLIDHLVPEVTHFENRKNEQYEVSSGESVRKSELVTDIFAWPSSEVLDAWLNPSQANTRFTLLSTWHMQSYF